MVDIGIIDPSKAGLAMGAGTLAAAISGVFLASLSLRFIVMVWRLQDLWP